MKSKMLGALALFTLIGALFIMQTAGSSPPTADAATGTIAALNVGTCLTTDGSVFKGDCTTLVNDTEDWEVREEINEVSTLYATYSYDPKAASGEPRVILTNSDLLKISIHDAGRDKRTGVLIGNDAANNTLVTAGSPAAITDPTTDLGTAIKGDLDDSDLNFPSTATAQIAYTDANFNFLTGNTTDTNVIDNSGNHTVNFGHISGGTTPDFHPGDFDVDNGAVVRFYGCVDTDATCGNAGDDSDAIKNLKDYIKVDEDTSNGEASGNTAPWLGVNASVPSGMDLVILAIYYRTSDAEHIVGGQSYYYCSDGTTPTEQRVAGGEDKWVCGDTGTSPDALERNSTANDETANPAVVANVDYTSDEIEDNDALVVMAEGDGDKDSVNLYLQETGRFTGRYEGYLRLTDADGDGRGDTTSAVDWGLEVKDAIDPGYLDSDTAAEREEKAHDAAAVLGVESGPVTIEYVDTDGRRRTLRIEIDNTAPVIQVTAPVNNSASDDLSPEFIGSFEDTDSGLVSDSFRLVVDNEVDGEDNEDFALDKTEFDLGSSDVTGPDAGVSHAGELTSDSNTYSELGSIGAGDLYDIGDDSCGDEDKCHVLAEDYDDGDTNGEFSDTLRLNLRDGEDDAVTRDMEWAVDFQAYVMDMAGNIGFSDSDPTAPRIINDLSTKKDDKRNVPNVFGYFSAHIISLDEKDPVIITDQSATGYYGRSDDENIADRSGVMIRFDGMLDASSVSTNTFNVALDDDTNAQITDVDVAGDYVFLKLANELASDAEPELTINEGMMVQDRAGNELRAVEFKGATLNDGITPRLSVSLSGGSGTGSGDEGPSKLTKNQITITVESDEEIQGSPRIAVVCSSLEWKDEDNSEFDIDDYIGNRDGASTDMPNEDAGTVYTCGYDSDGDKNDDEFVPVTVSSLSRPGNVWEFTWTQDDTLEDGSITAVAFGRDRSNFENAKEERVNNWGSGSAGFTLDRKLSSPKEDGGGDLQPEDGGSTKESRPFVLIEFNEGTTVTLDTVELDGVEIAGEFEEPQVNRFVYWPPSISQGDHEVEVEATDAAGNEVAFDYEFTVEERGDFLLELQAGWNAVSVPANPVDTAIGSVFTDPAVTTVIGWDTQGWRIAVRRDGVWESNQQYGALNDIHAKYGYWVKSDKFIDQPVALKGPISRSSGGQPNLIGIDTVAGWNFVGVVDQDGDQTEDDFGTSLLAGNEPVTAAAYLRSDYVQAYTWDPTFSRFDVIRRDDTMTIGQGVWVYYEGGIAP